MTHKFLQIYIVERWTDNVFLTTSLIEGGGDHNKQGRLALDTEKAGGPHLSFATY